MRIAHNLKTIMTTFFQQLSSAINSGKSVCLATVVKAEGSTPREAGAKMLVFSDGKTIDTIGGSLLEKRVIDKAVNMLKSGSPPSIEKFSLNDKNDDKTGMICGGKMQVFIEPISSGSQLYIFGAGHCGLALAKIAVETGFAVHIVDDRPEIASRERYPMAASITVEDYSKISKEIDLPDNAFIAIMTQGHSADAEVLENLITKKYSYIGLMASKRKREKIYDKLAQNGIEKTLLENVKSPIGLPIDAETPEEIAISILAEMIKVRGGA